MAALALAAAPRVHHGKAAGAPRTTFACGGGRSCPGAGRPQHVEARGCSEAATAAPTPPATLLGCAAVALAAGVGGLGRRCAARCGGGAGRSSGTAAAGRGRRSRLSAARLHGNPQTRSPLVNWYCYEAGIPLEMRDPRPSPHPFGQVPHLSDDGEVEVFESGAILLYLADKYGGLETPEKRAKYTKWVVWANSTLEELCFGPGFSGPRLSLPGKALDTLDAILGASEWLVDGEFSVADVAVASYLNYVPIFFGQVDLTQRPNVAAYMKRCAERPEFVKAFGEQHAAAVKAQVLCA
eukprot:CAMPEP_0179023678 /NCGR_PEP_ID=MMETSP0796-20121207/7055_1 /TAXON_ID=73915 /ORGANISM="Pyrodinium bahamense, Strain pbaha01" /LENGTH=295 /DNA_ID=CAMNT_0020719599 /DNA_START=45 /DNA_END=932 /DNA_ORIENTATION=-